MKVNKWMDRLAGETSFAPNMGTMKNEPKKKTKSRNGGKESVAECT